MGVFRTGHVQFPGLCFLHSLPNVLGRTSVILGSARYGVVASLLFGMPTLQTVFDQTTTGDGVPVRGKRFAVHNHRQPLQCSQMVRANRAGPVEGVRLLLASAYAPETRLQMATPSEWEASAVERRGKEHVQVLPHRNPSARPALTWNFLIYMIRILVFRPLARQNWFATVLAIPAHCSRGTSHHCVFGGRGCVRCMRRELIRMAQGSAAPAFQRGSGTNRLQSEAKPRYQNMFVQGDVRRTGARTNASGMSVVPVVVNAALATP